jgi:hypothetical protein
MTTPQQISVEKNPLLIPQSGFLKLKKLLGIADPQRDANDRCSFFRKHLGHIGRVVVGVISSSLRVDQILVKLV